VRGGSSAPIGVGAPSKKIQRKEGVGFVCAFYTRGKRKGAADHLTLDSRGNGRKVKDARTNTLGRREEKLSLPKYSGSNLILL